MALSGRLCIGGVGRTRAVSLRPIEIVHADVHDDIDISGSCVAVNGDRPRFKSPVARNCNRSRSTEEEVRKFDLGW